MTTEIATSRSGAARRQVRARAVRLTAAVVLVALAVPASAAITATARGRITMVQGHASPNCRTLQHTEIGTGTLRTFRIQDVAGDDQIAEIALAAITFGRDVEIVYDPAVTSGCGTEPRVHSINLR